MRNYHEVSARHYKEEGPWAHLTSKPPFSWASTVRSSIL